MSCGVVRWLDHMPVWTLHMSAVTQLWPSVTEAVIQHIWTVLSRFDVAEWKNLFKTPLILFKLISNTLPILSISPSASLLLTIDENLRCESLMVTGILSCCQEGNASLRLCNPEFTSTIIPITQSRILLLLIVVSTNLFTLTRFRRQLSKLIAWLQCLDSPDWSRRVELSKYATEGLFTSLFWRFQ